MDSKVSELEDLLESMEHPQAYPRSDSEGVIPNIEESEDDIQKLRAENEWLREVIIRSTREDFSNIREDSVKIRSPRDHVPLLPTISKSMLSPRATIDTSISEEEKSDTARKSVKVPNSFIRKQSSAKIIQKIKSHRSIVPDQRSTHDVASPTLPPAPSTSTSKRPLQAITEIKDNRTIPDPQSEQTKTVTLVPAPTTNQQTPNNRTRRSVKGSDASVKSSDASLKGSDEITKAPLSRSFGQPSTSWNGSGSVSRATSKYIEINNENQQPPEPGAPKEETLSTEPLPSTRHSKMSIPEVIQKMSDLEKVIFGRDKAYETDQVELKKQLEEMRATVVTLVSALSILTQKLA
jgi:hypothetical protein